MSFLSLQSSSSAMFGLCIGTYFCQFCRGFNQGMLLHISVVMTTHHAKIDLYHAVHRGPGSQSFFKLKEYLNFKVENFMCK